ncbi:MAG: hypothetical protein JXR91_06625 [Deltaproteobacteria bacterium]|nr:hypothetical protein [Deltaproteobacteria bacterium]
MRFLIIVFLTASLSVSCGSNEKGETPAKSDNNINVKNDSKVKINSKSKKRLLLKEEIIKAAGVNDSDNSTLLIEMKVDPYKIVSGKIEGDNFNLKLSGELVEDKISCWAAGTDKTGKTAWRGMLLGSGTGTTFNGTFTISDNGAENTLTGTWKSTK